MKEEDTTHHVSSVIRLRLSAEAPQIVLSYGGIKERKHRQEIPQW